MLRFFAAAICLSIFVSGVLPDTPTKGPAAASHDLREPAEIGAELEKHKAADPTSFMESDLDYRLGLSATDDGRKGTAIENLHAVSVREGELENYAIKRLSQIARSSGNLMLERLLLAELALAAPHSPPALGSRLRSARNRMESGDPHEAVRLLGSASHLGQTKNVKPGDGREMRGLMGEAVHQTGDAVKAREIFEGLLSEDLDPLGDHALAAVKGLDAIDSGNSGPLSTETHLQRATIYQSNREFPDARRHFEAVIAAEPGGPRTAEAIFQVGRTYAQDANYPEALKWFERVIERFPESPFLKDALLNSGSAYSRVGKPREAISRYQTFIEKFAADERLDRAYLNIVDIHRDQGSDTEALKMCAAVRELFKGKHPEAVALFTEARIHIARDEWPQALDALDRLRTLPNLGGAAVPGGTTAAETAFLRAFTLEQMQRYPEAIDGYLSIPDGRGEYYGWRATERLRLMADNELSQSYIDQRVGSLFAALASDNAQARERDAKTLLRLVRSPELRAKALAPLRTSAKRAGSQDLAIRKPTTAELPQGPAFRAAHRLFSLGAYDEALIEFDRNSGGRSIPLWLYVHGGRAGHALDLAHSTMRNAAADTPLDALPRGDLEAYYPAPFAGPLLRHARERGVDPRFILSIMRQESRFDPGARSGAAARGLMQFISTTASRVGGKLGREKIDRDDLYHPSTAILFGSQYLADLFAIFPEHPEAVAASYNGGEDNMVRWKGRSRSNEADRYVPEIVFSQTKDYVAKVMANYRVYQYLYDEQLRPRTE